MTSRNEQFVCFTAVLAITLPALMWFRYVGPRRAGVAADERALVEMRQTLSRYTEAELLPTPDTDRVQAEQIREIRERIGGLMGPSPSVSEVYRGIEQAAAFTRLTVSRIEPGKTLERTEVGGPLEEYAIGVRTRTYRVEIEGPARDLPVFIDALGGTLDIATVREVRAQHAGSPAGSRSVTASVTLETRSLTPLKPEGGGE